LNNEALVHAYNSKERDFKVHKGKEKSIMKKPQAGETFTKKKCLVDKGDYLIHVYTWDDIATIPSGEQNNKKSRKRSSRQIYLEKLNNGPLKEGTIVAKSVLRNKYLFDGLDDSRRSMYGLDIPIR
jgi:hypothetical protein